MQKLNFFKKLNKQAGLTLTELMVALAIGALVVAGAIAMNGSVASSQSAGQMNKDLQSIKASVKGLFYGQGGYGTASLNGTLINSSRVPSTMSVSGTTISHPLNGTLTITGATGSFTMTATAIPTDVCVSMLAAASGYTSVKVGANAAQTTFPITPTSASTDCSVAATQTIIFTSV